MKCIKKMILWLGLALALAGCNLDLANSTLPDSNTVLDNEFVRITITENNSSEKNRATKYTEEHWAYSTTTVLFNGTSSTTSLYSKYSTVNVECKKEGAYDFYTVAYKADMSTPIARSEITKKEVKFSEGKFNLETKLTIIYSYEGTEGKITNHWGIKSELAPNWFTNQTNVSKDKVKSIKLVANTKSLSNYTLSWSGGENVTVYYKASDGSITIAIPNKTILAPENSISLFSGFVNATSIDIDILDTSNVKFMDYLFQGCKSLTSLNIKNFNTSNVVSVKYMFCDCNSLTSLDLSSFDTSNITFMSSLFDNCYSLTSLDLSNFNTSGTISTHSMFRDCRSLTSVKLNNFNTANVNDMNYMFYNCSSLKSLNLSNFKTPRLITFNSMFAGCSSLNNLDLSNFDTSEVIDMKNLFNDCNKLLTLITNDSKILDAFNNK